MRRAQGIFLLSLLLMFAATISAFGPGPEEDEAAEGWDITAAHGPTDTLRFNTDEGTWISLDVSPNGREIVFDLLGDIYSMPITGGTATALTTGPAWDVQPSYSPDGKSIAITSDRDGAENIWIINKDGSNPRQVTKEKERILNNPVFTPDGKYIIARKHYRNTRSLGAGEMWLYHRNGGDGIQLTERRDWQHDAGEPDISPDGKYLYYSQDISPGKYYEYNRNPYEAIYAVDRLNMETGETERLINGLGGSMTPQVSPKGHEVAFIRRVGLKTALFSKVLKSGDERMIWDGLNRDSQETWSHFGTNPGFSWGRYGKSIIIAAQGHIYNVEVATGTATIIPFTAAVEQVITEAVRFPVKVGGDKFKVNVLRDLQVDAKGSQVLFQALGHIYRANLSNGSKLRLTGFNDRFEGEPAWSPRGKQIAFTTWSDAKGGQIYLSDSRKIRSLRLPFGHYFEPAWSPDGTNIVYRKGDGNWIRGFSGTADPGIYMIPSKGGKPRQITDFGSHPKFTSDGKRLLVMDREDGNPALVSIDLNGLDRRVLATGKYAAEIVLSPDENWLAFTERYHVYVIPFKHSGRPLELTPKLAGIPIARADVNGGTGLHWSARGNTLYWSLGSGLYSRKMSDLFDLAGQGDVELAGPDSVAVKLGWQHTADNPRGTIALVGAKVITMDRDQVYPDGTVLVRNGKIAAVGASNDISIPPGATVIDAQGKFIIPGLIDVHAHMGLTGDGLLPTQNWNYLANLAFGVTTTHDPSRDTELVFTNSELQKAGYILAPRIFSTGTILYGADASIKAEVNSLDDAIEHLKRLKAYGAFSVKSYNQPRRDQRQQIIKAARDLKMMVVPEGGSTLQWNLNMLLDGHTGIEHSIPVAPLYKDVINLWAATKVGYTPTLIVSYGGLWGEKYWYQHQNVFEHELLLNYTPRELLDRVGRRRMQAEDEDYNYLENARAAKVLADAGVKVNNGAHGQLEGLGVHWEMWMMAQGGMTPAQALQASTINGAEYLGLDKALGNIKVGKLADLVILSADPLVDIHNSEKVHQVMLNGRLYDAATLNEVAPNPKVRAPLWFK